MAARKSISKKINSASTTPAMATLGRDTINETIKRILGRKENITDFLAVNKGKTSDELLAIALDLADARKVVTSQTRALVQNKEL